MGLETPLHPLHEQEDVRLEDEAVAPPRIPSLQPPGQVASLISTSKMSRPSPWSIIRAFQHDEVSRPPLVVVADVGHRAVVQGDSVAVEGTTRPVGGLVLKEVAAVDVEADRFGGVGRIGIK